MYKNFIKRLLDILISILTLPLFIFLTIFLFLIYCFQNEKKIFYVAKRRGFNGSEFNMYKFRTMHIDSPDIRNSDNSTYSSKNDFRVTKIGKYLRKSSLDEIPQIINVIKGDMSIVGPRPITIEREIADYSEDMKIRLRVKPGITGYSQAYFRNSIPQNKKFEMDAWYAKNISFYLDLKIFIKTILIVINRNNIFNEGT